MAEPNDESLARRSTDTTPLEWNTPMYELAVGQLDTAASLMGLQENIWHRLRTPQRAHMVSIPFREDNYGTVKTVFGYRVQHLTTMGPGCRHILHAIRY